MKAKKFAVMALTAAASVCALAQQAPLQISSDSYIYLGQPSCADLLSGDLSSARWVLGFLTAAAIANDTRDDLEIARRLGAEAATQQRSKNNILGQRSPRQWVEMIQADCRNDASKPVTRYAMSRYYEVGGEVLSKLQVELDKRTSGASK